MNDAFIHKLQDAKSPEHEAILSRVKKLISKSRADMSKNYDRWDANDAIFRSERRIDKEDMAAQRKNQPAKMIVPLTKSQVLTFVAFATMTLTQNKRFFELEPTGTEDNPLVEPFELILERDTRRNHWTQFLVQFFLDIGRFSVGCAEVCYEEHVRMMRVESETVEEPGLNVVSKSKVFSYMAIPTFTGNKVHSVSPYRFFPDTSLPLTRYQEGSFCGSEDYWTLASLKAQKGMELFSLDKIPKLTKKDVDERQRSSRGDFSDFEIRENPNMGAKVGGKDGFVKSGTVLVTKIVLDLVPSDIKVDTDDGAALGEEDFPVRFVCWYANDGQIVRFDEAYWLHCQFPYIAAQFMADQHRQVNESLADDCDQITSLITWLINAHVTSVRSTIDSKFIIDPSGIDTKSLESRSPYIFLKKNVAQMGIDRYIKQFQTQDVTQAFMQDAAQLTELLEKLTGFSGNMMGQYAGGRRSATEARVVTQGASARAKSSLAAIWDSAFEPLARQFLANNRQDMDFETFKRVVGVGPFGMDPMTGAPVTIDILFMLFKADPMEIATSESFFVFDATLPSEKAFLAQSLQELLLSMMQSPEIMQVLGYGPQQLRQMIDDIYTLRGVTQSRLPSPQLASSTPPTGVIPMTTPGVEGVASSAVSNG